MRPDERSARSKLAYTDDTLIGVVGTQAFLCVAGHWGALKRDIGVVSAAQAKTAAGVCVLWNGIYINSFLGQLVVPPQKAVRAVEGLAHFARNDPMVWCDYRSLAGLLEHIVNALQKRRVRMYHLYEPFRALGGRAPGPQEPVPPRTPQGSEQAFAFVLELQQRPGIACAHRVVAEERVFEASPASSTDMGRCLFPYTDAALEGALIPSYGGYMHGLFFSFPIPDWLLGYPIPQQEMLATIAGQFTFSGPIAGARSVLTTDSKTSHDVIDHDGAHSAQMQWLHLESLRPTTPQCFSFVRHGRGDSNPGADYASRGLFDKLFELSAQLHVTARRLEVPSAFSDILVRFRDAFGARYACDAPTARPRTLGTPRGGEKILHRNSIELGDQIASDRADNAVVAFRHLRSAPGPGCAANPPAATILHGNSLTLGDACGSDRADNAVETSSVGRPPPRTWRPAAVRPANVSQPMRSHGLQRLPARPPSSVSPICRKSIQALHVSRGAGVSLASLARARAATRRLPPPRPVAPLAASHARTRPPVRVFQSRSRASLVPKAPIKQPGQALQQRQLRVPKARERGRTRSSLPPHARNLPPRPLLTRRTLARERIHQSSSTVFTAVDGDVTLLQAGLVDTELLSRRAGPRTAGHGRPSPQLPALSSPVPPPDAKSATLYRSDTRPQFRSEKTARRPHRTDSVSLRCRSDRSPHRTGSAQLEPSGLPAVPVLRSTAPLSHSSRPARYPGNLPPDHSPFAFDISTGKLEGIFGSIDGYIDLSVPEGTSAKDRLAWERWCTFCILVTDTGISPWRMDAAANSGADAVGFDREARLLAAFLIYCHGIIQPRSSKASAAAHPDSALNMVKAVRRVHKRRGIFMVSTAQLSSVMKGILSEHIAEHGYESLLPHRKEPLDGDHLRLLLSTPTGTVLGRTAVHWDAPLFLSLGGLFAVGASTGIRKAEGATPNGRDLDQRRLRRRNLLWRINGVPVADPSPEQLRNLVEGRDGAILIPPPSKADQFGDIWGVHPIHLPLDSSDRANAAAWLRRIELALPVRGEHRLDTALFVADSSLAPLRHSTVDTYLGLLLKLHFGTEAGKYSFHSFRIGFACALLAAGCDPFTIQALARWRSVESLRIYARMNPDVYAAWVSKALTQRASSTSTANLPVIDSHDALARLQASADVAAHGEDE